MGFDGSVKQILDPRVLTSSYSQMPGIVPTPFTDTWFVNAENIDDDSFRGMFDPNDMYAAPANEIGAEAHVAIMGDASERIFNMVYSFNKTVFGEAVLTALREPDSYSIQNKGATEVRRIMSKFVNRQRRFKELWIAKMLTAGVVYLDPRGRILESSTGAVKTCDAGVAAGHKGNLGGLISALFSSTDTDIPYILESIKDAARANGSPEPTDIWVNSLNLRSLRNNTIFKDWAEFNKDVTDKVLGGGIIQGLWGFDWHFDGSYYRGVDGSTYPMIPVTGQGSLVLTPDPAEPWCKRSQGRTLLPSSIGVGATTDEMLANLNYVYGQFAYAKLLDDPVRVMGYIGDKFGFNYEDPDAIWCGTGF